MDSLVAVVTSEFEVVRNRRSKNDDRKLRKNDSSSTSSSTSSPRNVLKGKGYKVDDIKISGNEVVVDYSGFEHHKDFSSEEGLPFIIWMQDRSWMLYSIKNKASRDLMITKDLQYALEHMTDEIGSWNEDDFAFLSPYVVDRLKQDLQQYLYNKLADPINTGKSEIALRCDIHDEPQDVLLLYNETEKMFTKGRAVDIKPTLGMITCKCLLHLIMAKWIGEKGLRLADKHNKIIQVRLTPLMAYFSMMGAKMRNTLDSVTAENAVHTPIAVCVKTIAHKLVADSDDEFKFMIRSMHYKHSGKSLIITVKNENGGDLAEWIRAHVYKNALLYWKSGINGFDVVPIRQNIKNEYVQNYQSRIIASNLVCGYVMTWEHKLILELRQRASNQTKVTVQSRSWDEDNKYVKDDTIVRVLNIGLANVLLSKITDKPSDCRIASDDSRGVISIPKQSDYFNKVKTACIQIREVLKTDLMDEGMLMHSLIVELQNRMTVHSKDITSSRNSKITVQYGVTIKDPDAMIIDTPAAGASKPSYSNLLKETSINSIPDIFIVMPTIDLDMTKMLNKEIETEIVTQRVDVTPLSGVNLSDTSKWY